MPRVKQLATGENKWTSVESVLKGFTPGKELVELLTERIPLPDGPMEVKAMLDGWYRDYEMCPGGQELRVRSGIRGPMLLKLMEFVHPKVKDGGPGSGPIGISVTVNSFAEDGKGEKVVMVPCGAKKVQPGGTNGVIDVPTVEVREV